MKIEEKIMEEVKIESYLPSKIQDKIIEYRGKGYHFEPIQYYLDKENQVMHYTYGKREKQPV